MIKKTTRKTGGKRKVTKMSTPREVERKIKTTRVVAMSAAKKMARRKAAPLAKKARVARSRAGRINVGHAWSLEELISKVSTEPVFQEEHRIEEAKFDIGVQHNGKAKPVYEIPFEYQVDRAVVLTVDPRFVFTYWEVKPESMHNAVSHLGPGAKLTLRFYDISATGDPDKSPSWDIEVFDRLGNWYLRLDYPEQILCLDVGMKNGYGAFHRIARSSVIRLPRQTLAAPGPLKWMIVTPDGQKLISTVEEYTDADLELLKKILGPYFFDLLMKGQFASVAGSSMEAIFQDISAFRMPMEISSSPSSWSGRP